MTQGTAETGTRATDDIHEAMRNLRRRYVVYYLSRDGGPVAVDDLAEAIAGWEAGDGDVTAAHRKSVYSALHQTHLPKLERVGVVEYDREAMTVHPTDDADGINFAAEVYRSLLWPRRYLALCGVVAAVLVASLVGVPPFGGLPAAAVAALGVVGLGGLAVAHYVAVRRWHRRFGRTRPDFVLDSDWL